MESPKFTELRERKEKLLAKILEYFEDYYEIFDTKGFKALEVRES